MANNAITQFPVPVVATPGLTNIWSANPGPTTVLYVNAALEYMKNSQIGNVVDNKMGQFYSDSIPDSENDDDEDGDDNNDNDDEGDDDEDFVSDDSSDEDNHVRSSQSTTFSSFDSYHVSSAVDKGKARALVSDIASLPPAGPSSSYPHVFQPSFVPRDDPTDVYMEPVSPQPSSSFNPSPHDGFTYDIEMLSPSAISDALEYGQDSSSLAASASNDNLPYTHILNSRMNFDLVTSESTASLLTLASGLSHHSVLDPSFDINRFLELLLASPEKAQDYLKSAGTSKSGKTTTVIGDMVASTRVVTTAYNAAHEDGWNRPTNPSIIIDTAQFTVTFFSTFMNLFVEKYPEHDLSCKLMYYII